MPPTWTALTFFYLHFHLTLLPTVIIGAIAATTGRVILALFARHYFRPFLTRKIAANYDELGGYLQEKQKWTIPIVVAYAFSPVSSNQLFIIAELTKLNLKIISFSFLIGSLISYAFWVSAAYHISTRLEIFFQAILPTLVKLF